MLETWRITRSDKYIFKIKKLWIAFKHVGFHNCWSKRGWYQRLQKYWGIVNKRYHAHFYCFMFNNRPYTEGESLFYVNAFEILLFYILQTLKFRLNLSKYLYILIKYFWRQNSTFWRFSIPLSCKYHPSRTGTWDIDQEGLQEKSIVWHFRQLPTPNSRPPSLQEKKRTHFQS